MSVERGSHPREDSQKQREQKQNPASLSEFSPNQIAMINSQIQHRRGFLSVDTVSDEAKLIIHLPIDGEFILNFAKASVEVQKPEPLRTRQQEVLALLRQGRTNPEIAKELGVSVQTVKSHVGNLFLKFNAHTRVELLHKTSGIQASEENNRFTS